MYTGKIIKLNYEINETLKMYTEILENPISIKSIDQGNEVDLLDLNVSSTSSGKCYNIDIDSFLIPFYLIVIFCFIYVGYTFFFFF